MFHLTLLHDSPSAHRALEEWPTAKNELKDNQHSAFHTFIDDVCSPPAVVLPKSDFPNSVQNDESKYYLGCTLLQTHENGDRKPIGYWSRSFNPAEKNYSASQRECLGVLWALLTLHPYLQ